MGLPVVASVFLSLSILLMFWGFVSLRSGNILQQRMQMYGAAQTIDEMELQQPFSERVLKPLAMRLVRLLARYLPSKRIDQVHQRLQMAGSPGGLSAADWIGVKGWIGIIMGGLGLLYILRSPNVTPRMLMGCLTWTFAGFRLPEFWLSRRIKQRQQALQDALPDALDMMTVAVEAGLSFDQALSEIVARWKNELTQEMRRVLYEIGVGKSRREALEQLSTRTQVHDIQSFVVAVNHAEDLGTSLGRVLNVQSQEMRTRRRQRAQEKANKLPVKMMFPLVFLIFPALFAVILGPAVPRIARSLGAITPTQNSQPVRSTTSQ